MRKLLNILICILMASPLAAFDIGLPVEGLQFGSLQMPAIDANTAMTGTSVISSNFLTLNDGDVLQVLRLQYGDRQFRKSDGPFELSSFNMGMFCNQGGITSKAYESDYVVGPSVIWVGLFFQNPTYESVSAISGNNYYVQMDYAILRAGASTQSSYITIPANSSGNFEVKLQTSSDLQTWSPTTPGIFPYGDNAKFFRLVVE